MSASLVTTRRTTGQLRGSLARIAQAASQIDALHERYGPDAPWGFADPSRLEVLAALLRTPRALPRRRRPVAPRARLHAGSEGMRRAAHAHAHPEEGRRPWRAALRGQSEKHADRSTLHPISGVCAKVTRFAAGSSRRSPPRCASHGRQPRPPPIHVTGARHSNGRAPENRRNTMPQETFAARYRAAERLAGGRCPIEAGLICRLADHECRHGRLAFDPPRPVAAGPRKARS